jgi:hypothetical protein
MFVRTGHLQHTLKPLLYKKNCTGMYSIINTICNYIYTSQPLLPVETCTRSWTPAWRLISDYWTCRTSAQPDCRDCIVCPYHRNLLFVPLSSNICICKFPLIFFIAMQFCSTFVLKYTGIILFLFSFKM